MLMERVAIAISYVWAMDGTSRISPAYAFISHSCSGALWNFQVRLGPAITLR